VSTVHWVPTLNCVMTGSWDRTVSFWNPATPVAPGTAPTAVHSLTLSERVYAADVNAQGICVVATADRMFSIFNLQPTGVAVRAL
jgi:hypothetical protein